MKRPTRVGLLLLAALFVVLAGAPAEAHRGRLPAPLPVAVPGDALAPDDIVGSTVDLPVLSWVAAPAATSTPWAIVVAVLGATAVGLRWPRRALAFGLVLLAAVSAFENGVHSVHHLTDPGRGGDCALASASLHVSGTEVAPIAIEWAPVPLGAATALRGPATLPDRSFRLPDGRAPPQVV